MSGSPSQTANTLRFLYVWLPITTICDTRVPPTAPAAPRARWILLRLGLPEREGEDVVLSCECEVHRPRRTAVPAGPTGDRQHRRLRLLRLECDDALHGDAAAGLPDCGDDAVRVGLLRILLGDPGEGAHARVVPDDRIAAPHLVGGGELLVDDELVALRENGGIGAGYGDETRIGGAVVDVERVVRNRSRGACRRGSGCMDGPADDHRCADGDDRCPACLLLHGGLLVGVLTLRAMTPVHAEAHIRARPDLAAQDARVIVGDQIHP